MAEANKRGIPERPTDIPSSDRTSFLPQEVL
jgi:hypothetical protein